MEILAQRYLLPFHPLLYGLHVGDMKLVAYSGVFMIISLFPLALIIYESLIQRKSLLKGHDP